MKKIVFGLMLVSTMGFGPYASIHAAEPKGANLEIILDASGSMAGKIEGKSKLDIAKEVLSSIINAIPSQSYVAFRAYGHQFPEKQKNCKDTALVVPFGPINKTNMTSKINALQPSGWTPIDYTLRQSQNDFPVTAEYAKEIILVSDGEESCGGDPCAAITELNNAGFNVKVNTVGFAVGAAAQTQLKCIASATGGEYKSANNAAELLDSLKTFSVRAFEGYTTAGGVKPGTGFADAPLVTPGTYGGDILGGEVKFFKFSVKDGQMVRVGVKFKRDKDAGIIDGCDTMGNFVSIHDDLKTEIGNSGVTWGADMSPKAEATVKFTGDGYISFGVPWLTASCRTAANETKRQNTSLALYDLTFTVEGDGTAAANVSSTSDTTKGTDSTTPTTKTKSIPWTMIAIIGGVIIALAVGSAIIIKRKGGGSGSPLPPPTPPTNLGPQS